LKAALLPLLGALLFGFIANDGQATAAVLALMVAGAVV